MNPVKSIKIFLFVLLLVFTGKMVNGMTSDERTVSSISLKECEKTGIENHSSIRLAKEETDVATLKEREALRAIFPSMILKSEQTDGKAVQNLGTPDFTEKSYGVQISQAIFQGGKLYRTFLQAQSNLESVRAKLLKAQQEVTYHVRESYWNMVKAYRTLEIHDRALVDLEKEKSMADKLLQNDAITPQVFMTINAQYNQAVYQVESAKAELEFRLWQWTAALGLKTPPKYRPDHSVKMTIQEKISLDECLGLAKSNHPDIIVQKNAADASRLGSKVARSYLWPQLDFNAFYGRSGAAYEGESLDLREDWQLGGRLAFYFGGNSASVSGIQQKTSQKIGQSSRTESRTVSASVGVLDGLKNKSEEKEASLICHQTETQLEATQMEVLNNVREAYANWKKALSQLKIAENELALALTESSVSEIKSSHRETPISDRAVARNKVAQAEVSLAEAQASYAVSVAGLNRAIGIPEKFEVVSSE